LFANGQEIRFSPLPANTLWELGNDMQLVGSELMSKPSQDLFQLIGTEHPGVLQLNFLQSVAFGHQTHISAFLKTRSSKSAVFLAEAHGLGEACIVHCPTIPFAPDQAMKAQ
jgi:hypothetical protein